MDLPEGAQERTYPMPDTVLRTQSAAPLPESLDALPDVLVPIPALEANDNEAPRQAQQSESRMFELPASVWRAMIACYAIANAIALQSCGVLSRGPKLWGTGCGCRLVARRKAQSKSTPRGISPHRSLSLMRHPECGSSATSGCSAPPAQ